LALSERKTPNGGTAILQTDVTDMVRWERLERDKRLDEQARLIRATLDHMSQGVCVFDNARRLLAWNDRYRDLLGLPFEILKPGVSFNRLASFFHRNTTITSEDTAAQLVRWVYGSPERQPMAVELRRYDDKILDAYCRTMPNGGFVISFTDVTAERRAIEAMHQANELLERRVFERTATLRSVNQQLTRQIEERAAIERALVEARDAAEAANRSKTRFLASASHDLLQPLNAARLFISSLQESPLGTEQSRVVDRIDRAFGSVEALLNTLLDISKIDTGVAEADMRPLALQDIFDAVANEFLPLAEAKGVRLSFVPTSAIVLSDQNYLLSVVQNLVSNAVKYTSTGRVLVGCRRGAETVRIEIHDTGVGIAEADRGLIFDEFRRVDGAGAIAERGLGLGLAIVDRACRLLGHELRCRSMVGIGSCFSVTLATTALAELADTGAVAAAPLEEQADGLIALLVENDPEIRAGMSELLERWGVSLLSAGSTDEAMEAVRALGMPPDIVLVDYHLDDGDTGLETAAALSREYGRRLPTILITADHSSEIASRAEASGAALLRKPVKPARLRSLMHWATQTAPRPDRVVPGATSKVE
ncbi:MAG: NahK/ErcS family hybrid sensor histidine kinase/response regulator, partial [Pseudomonadota bacterium]